MALPMTTSLRKCMPSTILDSAMLQAQNRSQGIKLGKNSPRQTAMANAVMECPEGNEN